MVFQTYEKKNKINKSINLIALLGGTKVTYVHESVFWKPKMKNSHKTSIRGLRILQGLLKI